MTDEQERYGDPIDEIDPWDTAIDGAIQRINQRLFPNTTGLTPEEIEAVREIWDRAADWVAGNRVRGTDTLEEAEALPIDEMGLPVAALCLTDLVRFANAALRSPEMPSTSPISLSMDNDHQPETPRAEQIEDGKRRLNRLGNAGVMLILDFAAAQLNQSTRDNPESDFPRVNYDDLPPTIKEVYTRNDAVRSSLEGFSRQLANNPSAPYSRQQATNLFSEARNMILQAIPPQPRR